MFNIWTPITYNTNLNSILSHYYMGFCGGNCAPFAPLFNPPWIYNNGIAVGNPYSNYSCNNYYPNVYALNYNTPINFRVSNIFQYQYNKTPNCYAKSTPTYAATKSKPVDKNANKSGTKNILGEEFVKTARKYSNCSEADGSNHKFCNNPTCMRDDPLDQEWCTDFVTYTVKESYKNLGKRIPVGFGSHDVRTMKNWAISNGYFIRTSDKSKKADYIAKNIKPGDIIILNENNASHTGLVTKIDKDTGIIHTIEGNRDDRVKEFAYSPNMPDISGFIRLAS